MQVLCWLLCLGLTEALAVLPKEQVARHAVKLYRTKTPSHGHSWVTNNCKRLVGLLRQKNVAISKLAAAATAVGRDQSLSEPEKHFQVHTLEVFQKELNESENLVFQAVHGLQRVLQGDYRDVVNMKESSRQRLEALREAAIKVETLGELGVFFTLFVVGLEFSPERLRKVWKTSVQGSCYLSLLMVGAGLLWGQLLHIRPTQTVFISTCLSLSSTPLVSRFLAGGNRVEREGDLDYSSVLLGMLVMQDVQLGLFIAVMPTLIQAQSGDLDSLLFGGLRVLKLLAQVLVSLAAVSSRVPYICAVRAHHPAGADPYTRHHEGIAIPCFYPLFLLAMKVSSSPHFSYCSSFSWLCWCCLPSCLQVPDIYGGSSQLVWLRSASSPLCWAAARVEPVSSPERSVMILLKSLASLLEFLSA
ncbi:hypothetical protein GOODEAATRI_005927 [Goodea atripinnis]|uniref:Cation/H+ exchanger transmembrane domain-containing protein n=1 Tax=Goodea atripinnis TaxID=208336 RepID=A0ABV0NIV3_9TELE